MSRFTSKDWEAAEQGVLQIQCKKTGPCTRELKSNCDYGVKGEVEGEICGHGRVGGGRNELWEKGERKRMKGGRNTGNGGKKPRRGSHQGRSHQGEKLLAPAWGRDMVSFNLFCQSDKENFAMLSASHSHQCSPPSRGFAMHSLHHRHLLRVVPRKPPRRALCVCACLCVCVCVRCLFVWSVRG